jgi:hypothetical protein
MRYNEMMNKEWIIASPIYSTTPSPLYLAILKLDLPHTHIPGGWFHLHQEGMRRKEAKERSCLQVCCPILTPSSSIYRCGHQRQVDRNTLGMASRTNGGPPRGGLGSADQWSVRPTPMRLTSGYAFYEWLTGGS